MNFIKLIYKMFIYGLQINNLFFIVSFTSFNSIYYIFNQILLITDFVYHKEIAGLADLLIGLANRPVMKIDLATTVNFSKD